MKIDIRMNSRNFTKSLIYMTANFFMKIVIFEMVILRKIAKIWDGFRDISKNLKTNYFRDFILKWQFRLKIKIFIFHRIQPSYNLPIKEVTVKSQSE